ncbi:MAG: guanylate kinase [Lachnospiraceae bacterium]|jgi:guanylate kinase|nr:guanylate kinase [Lachnospiraceae bacterium]
MQDRGVLTVISGFSGAGKGTLVKKLISEYDNYSLSVSMTTRAPREGEVDGKDYFFIDKPAFERNIENGMMLEHAEYQGNYYGTPREYVEKQLSAGKDVILEIEYLGAFQVKKMLPEALLLFVTPPSAEELLRRLRGRHTETEEQIQGRMKRAIEEADIVDKYEFILLNDDLDTCVRQTHEIIQNAKFSVSRNAAFIEEIKKELTVTVG